jgi:hypothetical protein
MILPAPWLVAEPGEEPGRNRPFRSMAGEPEPPVVLKEIVT